MNIENLTALAVNSLKDTKGPLKEFRQGQIDLFKENGLFSPIKDSYKFTNLETFFETLLDVKQLALPDFTKTDFPTMVFIDGELNHQDPLPQGVKITKISDRFDEIKSKLTSSNALSHLHHGLLQEGLLIEIEKNQEISKPIRILNLLSLNKVSAPTNFIFADRQSQVTVIEETISLESSHAFIAETYITALEGARVEHIQLDQESSNSLNHGSVFADVERDATVRSFFFTMKGKLNRKNLTLNLNEAGANGESYSLFLTNNREHSDINTAINHKAADTTSDQMAKGILDGESKGIFTGLIHIFPKSQRVASAQLNKNLLLSKKAQLHSQPQLEIFADDVKCSHGSTTGQLSDDEVFYFQARGIPADKARTLLAHGFGMEIVQKITNREARDYIGQTVMGHLETKFNLGGKE